MEKIGTETNFDSTPKPEPKTSTLFLEKLYEMLDDETLDQVITWTNG
jgi:hypothetical protein